MEQLLPVDQSCFTASENKEYSLQMTHIQRLQNQLTIAEQLESTKPLTYVKERAKTSLKYNQTKLEKLDDYYTTKKKELEDNFKLAMEQLEQKYQTDKEDYKQAIEDAERKLDAKSPELVRLQFQLNEAIKKRNMWFCRDQIPFTQPPSQPVQVVRSSEHQSLVDKILQINPKAAVGAWSTMDELIQQYNKLKEVMEDNQTHGFSYHSYVKKPVKKIVKQQDEVK